MMPSAGQGATSAMQDAVVLANCLFDLTFNSIVDVTSALESYQSQRQPETKKQFKISQKVGRIMSGH